MEKLTCSHEGCSEPRARNSKYCKIHKALARERFRDMIAEQADARVTRDAGFEDLIVRAHAAGVKAAQGARKPTPVHVVQECGTHQAYVGTLDDYPCGFAWVNVKPGTSAFAKFLVKRGIARRDSYYGGVCYWVSAYGQSMRLKEAYAEGYAAVLREAGIEAYAQSRMD